MMRAASTISSSVLSGSARERVKRVFATTWTQRIVLPHLISRVMQLGALVRILSSQHSKRHSPEGMMDQYSLRLLAKVNNPSKYLTALIRLPMLYERTHEFPWYFCDFIRFSNRHRSSRSIPRLAPAAQPRRLVCASCPPRTASRQVRVRTISDRRHGHSMEHMRSCNVSGSLLTNLWYCLSTGSSSASHVSI